MGHRCILVPVGPPLKGLVDTHTSSTPLPCWPALYPVCTGVVVMPYVVNTCKCCLSSVKHCNKLFSLGRMLWEPRYYRFIADQSEAQQKHPCLELDPTSKVRATSGTEPLACGWTLPPGRHCQNWTALEATPHMSSARLTLGVWESATHIWSQTSLLTLVGNRGQARFCTEFHCFPPSPALHATDPEFTFSHPHCHNSFKCPLSFSLICAFSYRPTTQQSFLTMVICYLRPPKAPLPQNYGFPDCSYRKIR